MYKTQSFVIEKKLASVYLDPSHPASFGGVDAVYRAIKEQEKPTFHEKMFKIG